MKKNAQMSSIDFLVAAFIFAIALTYIISNLNESIYHAVAETDYKYMIMTAVEISDVLIKNTGVPTAWNKDNVEFLGLASGDRTISSYKVDEFCELTQNEIRTLLRIPYYLHFSLIGNRIVNCTEGQNGTKVVTIRRNVLFEGKNGVLEVTLWR